MSSLPSLQPAADQDTDALTRKVGDLVGKPDHKWEVVLDGKALRREFRFKGFGKCWAFMNAVAERCKVMKHHPEWWNSYNLAVVTWTTHRPEGLTSKDVEMAGYCDEQARQFNEVEDEVEVVGCAGTTSRKGQEKGQEGIA